MNPPKKINELFELVGFGVFQANSTSFALPSYIGSPDFVDMEYIFNHSGDKKISAWVRKIFERGDTIEDISVNISDLFNYIIRRFSDKWTRLIEAFVNATYNPIDNYNMEEQENIGSKITNTSGQDISTYGFNSSSATPTGKSSSSVVSEGKKSDNDRTLTRKGNIGVTTSQQMIESEINLRKNDLLDIIFLDIDSVLARSLY